MVPLRSNNSKNKKKRNHLISQLVFVILLTFIIDAEFPSPSFRSGARRASFSTRTDACLFVCLFFLCLYLCEQGVKSKRQLRVESCRVAGPPRARTGPLLVTVISGRLKLEILYHSPRQRLHSAGRRGNWRPGLCVQSRECRGETHVISQDLPSQDAFQPWE